MHPMWSRRIANKIAYSVKEKKCEMCNKSENRMEVHHKDGNPFNNDIKNLQILCSSCHHVIDKRIKNVLNHPKWIEHMTKIKKEWIKTIKRDEWGRLIPKSGIIKPYIHTGFSGKNILKIVKIKYLKV